MTQLYGQVWISRTHSLFQLPDTLNTLSICVCHTVQTCVCLKHLTREEKLTWFNILCRTQVLLLWSMLTYWVCMALVVNAGLASVCLCTLSSPTVHSSLCWGHVVWVRLLYPSSAGGKYCTLYGLLLDSVPPHRLVCVCVCVCMFLSVCVLVMMVPHECVNINTQMQETVGRKSLAHWPHNTSTWRIPYWNIHTHTCTYCKG